MLTTNYKDITYYSEKDLGTLETDIYYILDGKGESLGFDYEKSIKKLSDNLNLYDLGLGNYLLESEDNDFLDSLKSKLNDNEVEIEGGFENKDKFYLILYKPKINGKIDIELENINKKIDNIVE